ncbi:MAG: DUF4367 domain-containing protein [Peptococcia bacterium]|jgi:hypothetical protein
MRKKELDNIIKENLQMMLETSLPVDSEKKWQDFERRLHAQQKEAKKKLPRSKFLPVAVFAIVFLVIVSFNPRVVIGFKNEVFKWLGQTSSGELVIFERHNPEYKVGTYEGLSWEEAKGMVVYDLQYPHYIPAVFSAPPQIMLFSSDYPKSMVTIRYDGEESFLIIRQENIFFEEIHNTFVPQNTEVQKIKTKDNLEVTLIAQDSSYQVFWTENLIRFLILSRNIDVEEIIKVIEGLK